MADSVIRCFGYPFVYTRSQDNSIIHIIIMRCHNLIIPFMSGAFEPPKGRKEHPTPHYSVEQHLNLNNSNILLERAL